jgi:hypothetical protein
MCVGSGGAGTARLRARPGLDHRLSCGVRRGTAQFFVLCRRYDRGDGEVGVTGGANRPARMRLMPGQMVA